MWPVPATDRGEVDPSNAPDQKRAENLSLEDSPRSRLLYLVVVWSTKAIKKSMKALPDAA
jgi:hypothetical protein